MLKKTVLIGVSGSIAAYKAADVVSTLTKNGINVETILTKNACKIISPTVFSTLSGNRCVTKTFDPLTDYKVEHISLAKKADLLVIAPATANIIAKLAAGIADDMLTTTALACQCPKLIAPAMNKAMYENPVVQDNLNKLRSYGWKIISPKSGVLACKDVGTGKLADVEVILDKIEQELSPKDLLGLNVLVTAGPTQEPIDPVRFITNHSSGKMGLALAKKARDRGAEVTLVCGPVGQVLEDVKTHEIKTAKEMADAVKVLAGGQDVIIKAAAVADFTPVSVSEQKIKKKDASSTIALKRTEDILAYLGEHKKDGQILCGFSMETEDLIKNSLKKLKDKNLDMICCNSLTGKGSGFKTDTNKITILTGEKKKELPLLTKLEAADKILDEILELKR